MKMGTVKVQRIPERTCVMTGFRTTKAGDELFRIVRTKSEDGYKIDVDESYNGKGISGRGAYIKRDIETVEAAEKNREPLKRALRVDDIPDEIFVKMKSLI